MLLLWPEARGESSLLHFLGGKETHHFLTLLEALFPRVTAFSIAAAAAAACQMCLSQSATNNLYINYIPKATSLRLKTIPYDHDMITCARSCERLRVCVVVVVKDYLIRFRL